MDRGRQTRIGAGRHGERQADTKRGRQTRREAGRHGERQKNTGRQADIGRQT